MPPGAMSHKIQVVFFLRRESASDNWLFGITWRVSCWEQIRQRDAAGDVLCQCIRSPNSCSCGGDICWNRLLFAFKYTSHKSHETYKHRTSAVSCSKRKLNNHPGQNDHSRQKHTTRLKYFVSIIILGNPTPHIRHASHQYCHLLGK